jgi:hypothetical protein
MQGTKSITQLAMSMTNKVQHLHNNGGKELETFSCFSSLPGEIRLKIWALALPGPRKIGLRIELVNPELLDCTPSSQLGGTPSSRLGEDQDLVNPTYRLRSLARPPAILYVNTEARKEAQRFYHSAFATSETSMTIPINFSADIVVLIPSNLLLGSRSYHARELDYFMNHTSPEDRAKVLSIALFHHERLMIRRTMTNFPNVKTMMVLDTCCNLKCRLFWERDLDTSLRTLLHPPPPLSRLLKFIQSWLKKSVNHTCRDVRFGFMNCISGYMEHLEEYPDCLVRPDHQGRDNHAYSRFEIKRRALTANLKRKLAPDQTPQQRDAAMGSNGFWLNKASAFQYVSETPPQNKTHPPGKENRIQRKQYPLKRKVVPVEDPREAEEREIMFQREGVENLPFWAEGLE